MAAEQNVRQYFERIEYPASREELLSAAQAQGAPQGIVNMIKGLGENDEFDNPNEVLEALGFEDQVEE